MIGDLSKLASAVEEEEVAEEEEVVGDESTRNKKENPEATAQTKRRLQLHSLMSALKLSGMGALTTGAITHIQPGGMNAVQGAILGALGGAGLGYLGGNLSGRARMYFGMDPLLDTQAVAQIHR